MASRIKGITIEIGGDTTKLDKALAGTNKEISQTQKALKDVERLLKMDPGNTELLEQRQRLLAQSVEATAEKLETLRQAAESADKALTRGNAYKEAYEPLKNELDDVNASMRALEANADSMKQKLDAGDISTSQYDAFTKKLDTTRKRANELEKAIEDVNKEFAGAKIDQSQYDALQRELIETEEKLKDLEDAAEESSVSLGKLEAATGKVSSTAGKISDAMRPVTTAIVGLGAAALATVPATEELRGDLSILENNARTAGVSMDATTAAFQKLNTVSGEVDSSIEAVSNLLQAGFTESNLQIAVEGLANAAITFPDTLKIESLADSLQETLATGEATGQFGELLDRLGIGAENFSDNLAMCATEADKQAYALNVLAEGPLKSAYQGWVENNQEMVANRDASLELQMAMAELAEQILPLVTTISELATDFLEWFNNLDSGSQKAVVAIAAVAAAISPLAGLISKVSEVLPVFTDLFSKLGAQGTIVAIAIGAIVAVIAMLADAWDQMSGAEKIVAILGLVTAAALTAAVAIGAFQSALTLGIAAAGIVAGIAAVLLAINSAKQRADEMSRQAQQSSSYSVPGFAEGGVVPPNNPFLAVLGDNTREPEVVSPYSTIKQATSDAIAERGGGGGPTEIIIKAGDGFTRNLSFSLSEESRRRGVSLVNRR